MKSINPSENPVNMNNSQKIALFDMDGTICDYVGAMKVELAKLRAPGELDVDPFRIVDSPDFQYLWDRMKVVKADEDWWANLPRYELGFDVMEMTKKLGYYNELLTNAPKAIPAALAGKLRWIMRNLDEDIDFTMTRNKSRHYGRVLVDDYPEYIIPWLEHRRHGLVIMPANEYNYDFRHEHVIRYDGSNKEQVFNALVSAYNL